MGCDVRVWYRDYDERGLGREEEYDGIAGRARSAEGRRLMVRGSRACSIPLFYRTN